MPAKTTFQSIRVRGPASFDQAIRVKGHDWPPVEIVDYETIEELDARKLEKSANLSDLASVAAARINLALGSAATKNAGAAGTAGAVLNADDPTTTNARTPTAHTHGAGDLTSLPAHVHAAGDITSGTLPDARIASAATWNAKGEPNSAAQSTLANAFAITGANDVFQDTGLSITLPSAGTYLLMANVRGDLQISAGSIAYIVAKLYNPSDSADVANSETIVCLTDKTNTLIQITASIVVVITVTAAKTIKLYASRTGVGQTYTSSNITSNSAGRTRLSYLKVA